MPDPFKDAKLELRLISVFALRNKLSFTPMDNVVIANPAIWEKEKAAFVRAGAGKLQVLCDFDRTLTLNVAYGRKASTFISVLRKRNYLSSEYARKAQALADKYYPLEKDLSLALAEKKKLMATWWRKHFQLLVAYGLKKEDIFRASKDADLVLRPNVPEFFTLLAKKDVPLVIFSASGFGEEGIIPFLQDKGVFGANVRVISNSFVWGDDGRALGVREPIVHVFNKDETLLQDYPFFPRLKKRKNVLILGDSLGDVGMAEGFAYEHLLKIGFLNENPGERLSAFKAAYDAVILNDGPFDFVNEFLREVFISDSKVFNPKKA